MWQDVLPSGDSHDNQLQALPPGWLLFTDAWNKPGKGTPQLADQEGHARQSIDWHGMMCCRIQPLRVTHSIPDCCGLILRSEHGSIVHTGDWKIEEDPVDGQKFDRSIFEDIGRVT